MSPQPGDLVAISTIDWYVQDLSDVVGVILSVDDVYMGKNMYTVFCDGEQFSVHESEIMKVIRRFDV